MSPVQQKSCDAIVTESNDDEVYFSESDEELSSKLSGSVSHQLASITDHQKLNLKDINSVFNTDPTLTAQVMQLLTTRFPQLTEDPVTLQMALFNELQQIYRLKTQTSSTVSPASASRTCDTQPPMPPTPLQDGHNFQHSACSLTEGGAYARDRLACTEVPIPVSESLISNTGEQQCLAAGRLPAQSPLKPSSVHTSEEQQNMKGRHYVNGNWDANVTSCFPNGASVSHSTTPSLSSQDCLKVSVQPTMSSLQDSAKLSNAQQQVCPEPLNITSAASFTFTPQWMRDDALSQRPPVSASQSGGDQFLTSAQVQPVNQNDALFHWTPGAGKVPVPVPCWPPKKQMPSDQGINIGT